MSNNAIISLFASPSAIHVMFSLMMRSIALLAVPSIPRRPDFSSKPRTFCCCTNSLKLSRRSMTFLRSPEKSAVLRSTAASMVSRFFSASECACAKLITSSVLGAALKSFTTSRICATALLKSRLASATSADLRTVWNAVATSRSPET